MKRLRRELARRGRLAAAALLARMPGGARIAPAGAWIFGAAVGRAYIDNSAALHRHVTRVRPDLRALWVIDRDSPDVPRARAVGPVAFRDELRTWVGALSARVHVISHGVHDVPGCSSRLTRGTLKVRLGHGLTALKKTKPRAFHSNASANRVFDLVPVASEFEKQNKRSWDIPDSALVVTGLPRFDELVRKARAGRAPGPRRILYVPTWRDWVPHDAAAGRGSAFFETVAVLLAHPELARILERHDAVIEVSPHRNLSSYLRELGPRTPRDRVTLAAPDEDVQDRIAQCDLLLTDYSSVAWDALYIDKPVLFFPFDLDRYEIERGGYLDLRTDLPGPSATTIDALLVELERALAGGCEISHRARAWQQRAFAYRDDANCARVLAAIEERVA